MLPVLRGGRAGAEEAAVGVMPTVAVTGLLHRAGGRGGERDGETVMLMVDVAGLTFDVVFDEGADGMVALRVVETTEGMRRVVAHEPRAASRRPSIL